MKPEEKIRSYKVPRTIISFYSKLYCKRKCTTKKCRKLVEATKSWLSLTEEEKHSLSIKFKECEDKFSKKLINCLEKAEPFMKKKKTQRVSEVQTDEATTITDNSNDIPENEQPSSFLNDNAVLDVQAPRQSDAIDQDNVSENCSTLENQSETADPAIEEPLVDLQQETNKPLFEPTPPNIKSGRELFEMLQATGEKIGITWTTLSNIEKSRYNRAILLLKKDYLQKYTLYLDSLSPKELFDHYKNKLVV